MPGGYLEEALWGAYVGTVTVGGPPLSDCDKQRFFESMATFEEATGIQVNWIWLGPVHQQAPSCYEAPDE